MREDERGKGAWRRVEYGGGRLGKESVTFFFRNFPDGCSADSLRDRFEEIGRVQEVVIPPKKDVQGKNFSFVRFAGKVNEKEVLDGLNQIWIGSYIIRAYLPMFARPFVNSIGAGRRFDERGRSRVWAPELLTKGWRENGVSYAYKLAGQGTSKQKVSKEGEVARVFGGVFSYQSMEEEGLWLRNACTGKLREKFSWCDHGEEIQRECGASLKITHLGSRLVLLQSGSDTKTEEVLEGFDEWTSFWFDWWRPWSPTDVNRSREVWTK